MNGQNLPFSELVRLAEVAADDLSAATGCAPERVDLAAFIGAWRRLTAAVAVEAAE